MRIEVVTLFPEMVQAAAQYGVTGGRWSVGCGRWLAAIRVILRATRIVASTTGRMAAGRAW